jgi:hypothetical protein
LPVLPEIVEAVGDPVHVLLDRGHHVGEHRGAAGPGDRKEVREAVNRETEKGDRAVGPFLVKGEPGSPLRVDGEERSRHRVETCRKDDGVELVGLAVLQLQALRSDLRDRVLAHIHEADVGAVEGREVIRVDAEALAPEELMGDQSLGHLRIVDDLADLSGDELRRRIVGCLVDQQVVVGVEERDASAFPRGLVDTVSLLWTDVLRAGASALEITECSEEGVPVALPKAGVVGLDALLYLGRKGLVLGRNRVVCRALEDEELLGLFGDEWDRLDCGRARANDADALAPEGRALLRPVAGVVGVAPVGIESLEVGGVATRQAAGGHDTERSRVFPSVVGTNRPAIRLFVEAGQLDAGVELDVAAELETVCHVVDVGEDLGLGREPFAPFPLLLELL